MMKVRINDKEYTCKVARTEEEKRKGLMGVEEMPENEGMLFVWDEEGTQYMWMKNCPMPIDQIGINEDQEVTIVYPAEPNNETSIPFTGVKYILELNRNSGVQVGDEVEFDDEEEDKYTMKILAPDGSTQMLLQGGERIFSRVSTRKLIHWAKKADSVKDNQDKYNKYCKRLGKILLNELNAQNNRDAEYVEVPDK